jgi:hypothetical protein
LENVRELLGAKALTLKFKKDNLRGKKKSTRAEEHLVAHTAKIHKAQWRYNSSREALVRLGATKDELDNIYKKLEKADLKYLEKPTVGRVHITRSRYCCVALALEAKNGGVSER